MMEALGMLDRLVDQAVETHDGVVVKPRGEGDSHFLVFNHAPAAVGAIADLQKVLAETSWPTVRPLKVRAALHTGAAELNAGDYYGSAVNRAARLRAIAHGGQTVMSRATWEQVADAVPVGVSIEDMGEHQLKDLTRPEQVFQILVSGLSNGFPPLASLENVPNNLPEQLTDFIGRTEELNTASRLLSDTRLLTILAPGGSGKTRLAIQTGADLAANFSDGVFFIGLAEVESADDIIQVMAEALGLGLAADEDLEVQLLNYLSNKEQLLIVDNFEHLSNGAALVSAILKRAPHVKIVATSRSKLNLSGETVMSIAGLETTWETAEEGFQTSGVQLFVDAATRSTPGFELSEEDLDSLARILRLIDGLPLAILLAASWVDMLGVSEIADEIAKSLDFLETEMGDVPDRHRSVRAVFDYSWALLDDDQRATFSRLSVFRGGFTREAAAQVAGASLRNLSSLAGKSLIAANVESGRYSVHEMLRQFAEAELRQNAQECERVLEAHAQFYGTVIDEAVELLAVSDQPRMFELIETDLDNLRSAWRQSLRTGDTDTGIRILRGLYFLYEWRGWYPSAVGLFGEALDALDETSTDDSVVRLRLMSTLVQGWFRSLIGQADVGAVDAVAAYADLPGQADSIDHWIACQCVALVYGYTGQPDQMARITDEGIEHAEPMEDTYYAAGMKNWRSFAAVMNQDPETAERLLTEAMVVFEERGDYYFMTWALWLLSLVALAEGRPIDAIDYFERQVAAAESIGYLRGRVVAFEGLGDSNTAAGRPEEAEIAYIKSLAIADQMGMVADMLGLMVKIANIWAVDGREVGAVEMLSTVCADPLSDRMTFTYSSPIRESASVALDELETVLEEATFAEAKKSGQTRDWEIVAKELMNSLDRE